VSADKQALADNIFFGQLLFSAPTMLILTQRFEHRLLRLHMLQIINDDNKGVRDDNFQVLVTNLKLIKSASNSKIHA